MTNIGAVMSVFVQSLIQSLNWAKDPQSWIGIIAIVTVLGFCAGLFDPGYTASPEQSAQASRTNITRSGA